MMMPALGYEALEIVYAHFPAFSLICKAKLEPTTYLNH